MVNSANTFLVLPLEDEVGTEGVSSHCLVQSLPVVLLGGTSFPAAEAAGCATPCWRLRPCSIGHRLAQSQPLAAQRAELRDT